MTSGRVWCVGCETYVRSVVHDNWHPNYCGSCQKRCKCGFDVGNILEYKRNFKIGGEDYVKGLYKIYRMDKRNIYIATNFLIMLKTHFKEYEEIANKYLMLM